MPISTDTRQLIQTLYKQGHSIPTIARRLHCSTDTVHRWIHRPCLDPQHNRKVGVGRRPTLGVKQQDKLVQLAKQHNQLGSRRLTPHINKQLHTNLTDRTVRHYLQRNNLKWKKRIKKPVLSTVHKQKRLEWAKRYIGNDWTQWIFSDETSIDIYGNDYGQRVSGDEKAISEQVSHPVKVSVWWAISGRFEFVPYLYSSSMNQQLYVSVLQNRLPAMHQHSPRPHWVFQQDNHGAHTAQSVREFLDQHTPHWTSDWPPNSPDRSEPN